MPSRSIDERATTSCLRACLCAGVVLVSSCGVEEAPEPEHASVGTTSAESPGEAGRLGVDGVEHPIRSAFAWRNGPDVVMVVSTLPRSCEALQSRMGDRGSSEVVFEVVLRESLAPDGSLFHRVASLSAMGGMEFWDAHPVPVSGTPEPGRTFEVTLAVGTYGDAFDDHRHRHLRLEGRIRANRCPAQRTQRSRDREPGPVLDAPQPAWIEVSGHRLPIVGALWNARGELILSTAPASCRDHLNQGAQVLQELGQGGSIGGRALPSANLWGTWFHANIIQTSDRLGLGYSVSDGDAPGFVGARLEGAGDVGGYRVRIEGRIRALDCSGR